MKNLLLLFLLCATARADPITYHFQGTTAYKMDLGGHGDDSGYTTPYSATIVFDPEGISKLFSDKTAQFLDAGAAFTYKFEYPEDHFIIGSLPGTFKYRYEYVWWLDFESSKLVELYYIMDHEVGEYVAGEQWIQKGIFTPVEVAEPVALVLLGVGLVGFGLTRKRGLL